MINLSFLSIIKNACLLSHVCSLSLSLFFVLDRYTISVYLICEFKSLGGSTRPMLCAIDGLMTSFPVCYVITFHRLWLFHWALGFFLLASFESPFCCELKGLCTGHVLAFDTFGSHLCVYTYVYTYICTHRDKNVCTHTRIYIMCMYVCIACYVIYFFFS